MGPRFTYHALKTPQGNHDTSTIWPMYILPKRNTDKIHTCMSVTMPRCTGLEVKRHLFLSSLNTFKGIQTSSQVSTPRSTTRFASLPSHLDWSTSGRWPGITLCACVNLRFFCCRAWEFVFICCIIVTMAFSSAILSGASATTLLSSGALTVQGF